MLQDALQFFSSDLIFPSPASKKKHKIPTMTEPAPPPRSPNYASLEVTQDSLPLQGDDNDPLSYLPEGGFDDWSTADTARIFAMTGCNDKSPPSRWMLGAMERGIVLIFIPLLTLSTDVILSVASYSSVGRVATWHWWHLGVTKAAVVQLRC